MARIRAFAPVDNLNLRPFVPLIERPEFIEEAAVAAIDDRPRKVDDETTGVFGPFVVLVKGEFNRPNVNDWTGRIETVAAFSGDELAWTARGLNLSPIWVDGTHPAGDVVRQALAWSDVFVGSARADRFRGHDGDDALHGRAGADLLRGDRGDDRLHGESGRDRLLGNTGDDALLGGRGRDALVGGRGDDLMRGGGGRDRFVFREGDGEDVIRDFTPGRDVVAFRDGPVRFGQLELSETDRGVRVHHGEEDSILLVGVAADELSRDDFAF